MKIAIIIQARMSSKRLPGKMLIEIDGKNLLQHVVDRIQSQNLNVPIIIATSDDKSDDALVNYCKKHSIFFFQGSLKDVYLRYLKASQRFGLDAFVRITGDSPLIDPNLIEHAIELFKLNKCDLVTNVFPRSFPKGQSIEVISSKTFSDTYSVLEKDEDYEHITSFFYRHAHNYSIINFSSGESFQDLQLSIDTEEDLKEITSIIKESKVLAHRASWKDFVCIKQKINQS